MDRAGAAGRVVGYEKPAGRARVVFGKRGGIIPPRFFDGIRAADCRKPADQARRRAGILQGEGRRIAENRTGPARIGAGGASFLQDGPAEGCISVYTENQV